MAYLFDSNGFESDSGRAGSSEQGDPGGYQYFKRRLHEEVLRSQRRQHPFTLMRLALNGPAAQGIDEIARVLLTSVREYDLVCQVQTNDFAIVLPETSQPHAPRIAERICKLLGDRLSPQNEGGIALGARIGIAYFPQDGSNAEDLLQSAEFDLQRPRGK